jgi:hypothetical protein
MREELLEKWRVVWKPQTTVATTTTTAVLVLQKVIGMMLSVKFLVSCWKVGLCVSNQEAMR